MPLGQLGLDSGASSRADLQTLAPEVEVVAVVDNTLEPEVEVIAVVDMRKLTRKEGAGWKTGKPRSWVPREDGSLNKVFDHGR